MSYSRWGDSHWYTYWATNSGFMKDEQLFAICLEGSFTYKELKDDLEECLNIVRDRKERDWREVAPDLPKVPEEYYEELRGYMKLFLADVEREYERCMKGEPSLLSAEDQK